MREIDHKVKEIQKIESLNDVDKEKSKLVLFTDKKVKGIQKEKKGKGVFVSAQKKKYELGVVYKKTSGKMGVRKIKIVKMHSHDIFTNPELGQSFREQYAPLLVDSPSFDKESYDKYGKFFNRKFWEINAMWGLNQSTQENIAAADLFLRNLL